MLKLFKLSSLFMISQLADLDELPESWKTNHALVLLRISEVRLLKTVVLNLGSIEPLRFDGAVSGVRRRSSET